MSEIDPNGTEWVRVKDAKSADGRHLSVPTSYLSDDRYQKVPNHKALDADGKPLAPKYGVDKKADKPASASATKEK